jgi:hypothetical protein
MGYRVDDFSERYRSMSDGELIELAAQKKQLTAEACTALESELAKRNIVEDVLESSGTEVSHEVSPQDEYYPDEEFLRTGSPDDSTSDLVVVFSAESETEAKALQVGLGHAGIESQLQIVVLVAQDTAEAAIKIVSDMLDDESEPKN